MSNERVTRRDVIRFMGLGVVSTKIGDAHGRPIPQESEGAVELEMAAAKYKREFYAFNYAMLENEFGKKFLDSFNELDVAARKAAEITYKAYVYQHINSGRSGVAALQDFESLKRFAQESPHVSSLSESEHISILVVLDLLSLAAREWMKSNAKPRSPKKRR